ncbi:MAG: zinc-binding alcohol dehydrogenase family protein [bacterium]
MRNFAICGRSIPAYYPDNRSLEAVSIDGVRMLCGVIETADRAFDTALPARAHDVLVRVRRFSCNYRDKSFVMRAATRMPDDRFYVIGSEFVGEVAAVGPAVTRVQRGDRVMGDNTLPFVGPGHVGEGPHGGIPTNNASGEYLVLHEDKVMGIPSSMPDDVAAAFSIGAQTAFSMVDKLGLAGGEHVLVTAASSNTSLFAIEALRQRDVAIYATTTSEHHVARLLARGVREVFVVPSATLFSEHASLVATARRVGGFAGVIDPFLDLHLHKVLGLMRTGGRYVSCGMHDQLALTPHVTDAPPDYRAALATAIVKNISIVGSCVGLRHHLAQAVSAYDAGRMDVPIDSVFTGDRAGAFLERTFTTRDRFGKVVYAYE